MTDRIHSLTVVLEQNIRDDDAKPLMDAIAQMRGVLSVTEHVADVDTHMAEERARHELRRKLYEVLK
jgi:hypothetical protein